MKIKVSSNRYGFIILIGIVLVFILFQLSPEKKSEVYTFIILLIVYLFFFVNALQVRDISYDEEYVYLKRFRKEILLNYLDIVKIRRSGSLISNETHVRYRYKLVYTINGKEQKCIFYIPQEDVPVWNRFKEKLLKENPLVEIKE